MGQHRHDADARAGADWRALSGTGTLRALENHYVCLRLAHHRIVAPLVLDGPINGQTFRAWVEQMLVPTLRPGDVVVLDNLGSHKVSGIAEAIQAAGAQFVTSAL